MEMETMPRSLYPPHGIKPDLQLCIECAEHEQRAWRKYGYCRAAGISAYFAQIDGFCKKIAENRSLQREEIDA